MKTNRRELEAIVDIVDALLSPLGFAKKGLNWRCKKREVLQQFTVFYARLPGLYHPDWGLNLLCIHPELEPPVYKLQVRWQSVQMMRRARERMLYHQLFDLNVYMEKKDRQALVKRFMRRYVIPCFEQFDSKAAVRSMFDNFKTPYRAHIFMDLPSDWKF